MKKCNRIVLLLAGGVNVECIPDIVVGRSLGDATYTHSYLSLVSRNRDGIPQPGMKDHLRLFRLAVEISRVLIVIPMILSVTQL